MHKIFGIVFMCIFALTHHLPTISASASDLLSSSYSSTASSSSSSSSSENVAASSDITTAESGDVSVKATDLFAIENDVAGKELISIAASSSTNADAAAVAAEHETEFGQQKLATRRQTRSLFYSYPYGGGLYNNLYAGYGGSYYYPSYSYAYYPSVYKYWGGYNPYGYGYPSVIYG